MARRNTSSDRSTAIPYRRRWEWHLALHTSTVVPPSTVAVIPEDGRQYMLWSLIDIKAAATMIRSRVAISALLTNAHDLCIGDFVWAAMTCVPSVELIAIRLSSFSCDTASQDSY